MSLQLMFHSIRRILQYCDSKFIPCYEIFFFSAKKTSLKNKIILSSFVQSITEFGVILNNTFYILSLFSTSGITSG